MCITADANPNVADFFKRELISIWNQKYYLEYDNIRFVHDKIAIWIYSHSYWIDFY